MMVLMVEKDGAKHAFTYTETEEEDARRDQRRFILAGWSTRLTNTETEEEDR